MAKRSAKTMRREQRRTNRTNNSNVVYLPTQAEQTELDERFNRNRKKAHIEPKSPTQRVLWETLCDYDISLIVATGPAGTGKTYVSTTYAIRELKAGDIDKIIITRPNVSVDDRTLGHLPGTLEEKMAPWVQPILDIFYEYYTKDQVGRMINAGVIEIVPTEYLRGRTFKRAMVLADEVQNLSVNGMKSLLTRIGDDCRMVVMGDIEQSDQGKDNGLADFLNRLKESKYITTVEFSVSEVQRSPVVKDILKMYQ